jgi:hypothetical protein
MSTASNPATGLTTAIPFPIALPAAGPPVVRQESVIRQIPSAQPYRFTVEQLEQMIKAGVLGKYDRCELIRGELIQKMTIGDRHMATVKRLNRLLQLAAREDFVIGVQDAVKLADSRPEPDISILRFRSDYYQQRTPE